MEELSCQQCGRKAFTSDGNCPWCGASPLSFGTRDVSPRRLARPSSMGPEPLLCGQCGSARLVEEIRGFEVGVGTAGDDGRVLLCADCGFRQRRGRLPGRH